MSEVFKNFVINVKKLRFYHILSEDDGAIIVGTKINILEHQVSKTSIFNDSSWNVERVLPVFCMIIRDGYEGKLLQKYNDIKMPLLKIKESNEVDNIKTHNISRYERLVYLPNDHTKDEALDILDKFVTYGFGY